MDIIEREGGEGEGGGWGGVGGGEGARWQKWVTGKRGLCRDAYPPLVQKKICKIRYKYMGADTNLDETGTTSKNQALMYRIRQHFFGTFRDQHKF